MESDLAKVLVTRERIAERVRELARELGRDLGRELSAGHSNGTPIPGGVQRGSDAEVVFIPVMTGALVFAADLVRELPIKLKLGLVAVSSYPGASVASKGVKLKSEIPGDLAGKHVVVVDDILDSGQTLAVIRDVVLEQRPASLRICVLLRKPRDVRVVPVDVQYVGFEIPGEFVVGYGLDYDGFYRNLPEIATLSPEAIRRGRVEESDRL